MIGKGSNPMVQGLVSKLREGELVNPTAILLLSLLKQHEVLHYRGAV